MVKHESPYLSSIGRGTMVADGLSILNADFSSTSFKVSRTSIGPHNFLGNGIAYPSQGRTGENCLLATKVLVPIDGKIREGVGLLGSPSFEIPRSVQRDATFDHLKSELPSRLAAKNRYNLRTMGVALVVRWGYLFGVTLLAMAMAHYYRPYGAIAVAVDLVLTTLFTTAYFVLMERGITRFRGLRPQFCSIYDPVLLVARALLETRYREFAQHDVRRHALQEPRSRGRWACGSAEGSSTTAARDREDTRRHR